MTYDSEPLPYTAAIDAPDDATSCSCGDCDWAGRFSDLAPIGDCMLTPGDPSPAGRCPECDTLAYIDVAPEIGCAPTVKPSEERTLMAKRLLIAALALNGEFPATEPEDMHQELWRRLGGFDAGLDGLVTWGSVADFLADHHRRPGGPITAEYVDDSSGEVQSVPEAATAEIGAYSAAPDMLAALRLAEEQLDTFAEFDRGNGGEDAELHDALAAVRNAIAEGEGRAPA